MSIEEPGPPADAKAGTMGRRRRGIVGSTLITYFTEPRRRYSRLSRTEAQGPAHE